MCEHFRLDVKGGNRKKGTPVGCCLKDYCGRGDSCIERNQRWNIRYI